MFVLASASPRRRDLLRSVQLAPSIAPQDLDETPHPGEAPLAYALRIATEKALRYPDDDAPVLAADTVVALDGEILGKARDREEACAMLARLSGRTHAVHTAVVLRVHQPARLLSDVVTTEVRMRRFGRAEIERYVDSGEPMDKAGAYAIQGLGGALVAEIRGSYTNVVGLPLEETLRLLGLAGVLPPDS